MDPARVGECRVGFFRVGVYRDDWDRLLAKFKAIGSCEVTRRKLGLGARDITTGLRAKNWSESTIEIILIPREAAHLVVPAGIYVRLHATALTADGLEEGDENKTSDNVYYEVKAVKEHSIGDSFSHRECDLIQLPLHE